MSYDLLLKRRVDEIEEKLLKYTDPIERMHVWFVFIKEFTAEAHALLDAQYNELVSLCSIYSTTPDLAARSAIRYQVVACCKEIENLNTSLKRIPRLQSKLEKDITDTVES